MLCACAHQPAPSPPTAETPSPGPLMMVAFRGPLTDDVVASFRAHHFGGLLLINENKNASTPEEVAALIRRLREASPGLLVATDQEGGHVCYQAAQIPCLESARASGERPLGAVREQFKQMGAALKAASFDLDLAPVADIYDGVHPFMKDRSFGTDPSEVTVQVMSAVVGLHDAGVLACAKHFPGHGAASGDSHKLLPRVDLDRDTLQARDWSPFRAAVAAGVDLVMVGHLDVPAIDPDLPTSVSPKAISLVREALGFRGAIISDDLQMQGVASRFGVPEAALRFLTGGGDFIIIAHDLPVAEAAYDELSRALADGRYPREKFEASLKRVEALHPHGDAVLERLHR